MDTGKSRSGNALLCLIAAMALGVIMALGAASQQALAAEGGGGDFTAGSLQVQADHGAVKYGPWEIGSPNAADVTATIYEDGTLVFSGAGDILALNWSTYAPWAAFSATDEMKAVKHVVFEDGVAPTKLDLWFRNYPNLVDVGAIPASVTSMSSTFDGCASIASVEIPQGVTNLDYAFARSGLVKAPAIPEGVISMQSTFMTCSSLTEASNIPSTVTNAQLMFQDCTSLTKAPTIAEGVTALKQTFQGCTALADAPGFPSTITSLEATFDGCTSLENVALPQNVRELQSTFNSCTGLKQAPEIPSSVTNLSSTFSGCTSLEEAPAIPEGVTNVSSAFSGCTSIKRAPALPSGITAIGSMFSGCTSLEEAPVIPDGVMNMNGAFRDCSSLYTAPLIPAGVTNLTNAFNGCSSMVTLPEGFTPPAGARGLSQNTAFKLSSPFSADAMLDTVCADADYEALAAAYDWEASFRKLIKRSEAGEVYGKVLSLEVLQGPSKVDYKSGEAFDPTGMVLKANYSSGGSVEVDNSKLTFEPKYIGLDTTSVKVFFTDAFVTVDVTSASPFEGSGTEDDPIQIATADDYGYLRGLVNGGESFAGKFVKQTADVELPAGWEPIGVTKDGSQTAGFYYDSNLNAFEGTLDGGGFTVTVPEGGKPLFGCVQNTTVKNLCIYGKRIEGYGLVDNLIGIGLVGQAAVLDNITVKSGTNITKSGLVGGIMTDASTYAATTTDFVTTIRNCTVEEGVVVGCDGDQSDVGGIAGRFQGTIENCTCAATVKGVDAVGGIVASQDQAMQSCVTKNCTFSGTVEATGMGAGGIMGTGYIHVTAPNAYNSQIIDCTVDGTVNGNRFVGGILGSEGSIEDVWRADPVSGNAFIGTVSGNEAVGGIIGYQRALNKNNAISNNYYKSGCGADKGIGRVDIVDTSHEGFIPEGEKFAWVDNTLYYNSSAIAESDKRAIYDEMVKTWEYGDGRDFYAHNYHLGDNRTDDPLGDDAELMCFTDEQLADRAAIEAALAEVPEGFEDSVYTDASVQALQDAVAAASKPYLPAWKQDAVVTALQDAIAGLKVDVDKAVVAAEAAAADAQAKAEAARQAADAATAAADKASKSGSAEDAAAAVKAAEAATKAAADAQAAVKAAEAAAEVAKDAAEASGDQGAIDRAAAAANAAGEASKKASAAADAAAKAAGAAAAADAAAKAPKDNPMKVKAKSVKVKAKKLKKKAKTVKALTVTGAQGKVTYKIAKITTKKKLAKQAKKKIKMAAGGKLKLKKKLKKGSYKVTVAVTAAGNASYKAATQTVTVKVKVK